MKRRDTIKALAMGALAPHWLAGDVLASGGAHRLEAPGAAAARFESDWRRWPDVRWAGPACWANRLQDWRLRGGRAECTTPAPNRTLHCLTHRLSERPEGFEVAVTVEGVAAEGVAAEGVAAEGVAAEDAGAAGAASQARYAGVRLGATGPFDDYRSAAVFGEGLDAGLTADGRLFIGEERGDEVIDAADRPVRLRIRAAPEEGSEGFRLTLAALGEDGQPLAQLRAGGVPNAALTGNAALVSHVPEEESEGEEDTATPPVRFGAWAMQGPKIDAHPERAFGPVCFAQYTLHRGTLKLTAQLAPIEAIDGVEVALEVRDGDGSGGDGSGGNDNRWRRVDTSSADPLARTARFRAEGWAGERDVPYRVRVALPLGGGQEEFFYEGTIAREPTDEDQLRVGVFNCNADHGFPNGDIVRHAAAHDPHVAVFLGDQFYEASGGYGVQFEPLEEATLDVLYRWYLFGWSYRDLFRSRPAAVIPDDHDVYHGNLWGEKGADAPTDEGWGYAAQDAGGYKMPPEWVNAIQRAETSHLPDPYDPTPVRQGINVYYTGWDYGGVSFAILEDRKFKTPPGEVLPAEAQVVNGYVTNPDFDITAHTPLPEAYLLGERQRAFLEDWSADWDGGAQMKAVLSQTNFCAAHTLPEGATSDQMVPELRLPMPGEYIEGDAPALDMDTNGWPPARRDDALRLLRRAAAFHIAGDQHLATVMQYGIDDFEDAPFAFTGPALNNLWPRRWWPSPAAKAYALPGDAPAYTGGFRDAFGNRLTMRATANPRQTGLEPSILYDRVTGYGIVTFDKARRTITMECWPRQADPSSESDEAQFDGWPLTIAQQDNDGRTPSAWLPEVEVRGLDSAPAAAVLEVVNEASGERLYTRRMTGRTVRPGVFAEEGTYTVRVKSPEQSRERSRTGVRATTGENAETLVFTF